MLGLDSGYTVKYTPSLQEFPQASPSGTPSDEGVYLTVCPSSRPNTDTVSVPGCLLQSNNREICAKQQNKTERTQTMAHCIVPQYIVLKRSAVSFFSFWPRRALQLIIPAGSGRSGQVIFGLMKLYSDSLFSLFTGKCYLLKNLEYMLNKIAYWKKFKS